MPTTLVPAHEFSSQVEAPLRNTHQRSPSELIESRARQIIAHHPHLRGRRHAVEKGRAVLWLLEQLGLDRPSVLPIYLGDDVTDEDAFGALTGSGIGILVSETEQSTQAMYRLHDPEEVQQFLTTMTREASLHA